MCWNELCKGITAIKVPSESCHQIKENNDKKTTTLTRSKVQDNKIKAAAQQYTVQDIFSTTGVHTT